MPRVLATAAAAVALAIAGASTASAATFLTVGGDSGCAKGGCFGNATHTYSQTFSAEDFSGPVSISSLKLFKSLLGDFQNNVVKVSFQLGDGAIVGDWGGFMVAALSGDLVTLGGKAFDWNPEMGDLTVTFSVVVPNKDGGGGFGSARNFLTSFETTSPIVMGGGSTPPPRFDTPTISFAAVPEPSAWLLAIGGFGLVGAIARRKRAQLA